MKKPLGKLKMTIIMAQTMKVKNQIIILLIHSYSNITRAPNMHIKINNQIQTRIIPVDVIKKKKKTK